ncbi:MAG TPA: DUF4157 domain-containing protein [Ktedonobacteraceae bacterium]|nr:DUF4157 domain-containing protein [Ktedonobacteraceae bacterium]
MKALMSAKTARLLPQASKVTRRPSSPDIPGHAQNTGPYISPAQLKQSTRQRQSLNSIPILPTTNTLALTGPSEAPVSQKQITPASPVQRNDHQSGAVNAIPYKQNRTGLPDHLKTGIERLSGSSLDDVQVHYNSSKPTQINALAYTQGRDIYVGPGQESHLAHEAWHAVQQKQGLVGKTALIKGIAVNNDQKLEKEADVMGEHASHSQSIGMRHPSFLSRPGLGSLPLFSPSVNNTVVQRRPDVKFLDDATETQVKGDIAGGNHQDALDHLMATAYFKSAKPAHLHSVIYDSAFSDYGQAEQDAKDPATNKQVDIRIGPPAYKNISILVSTLQHELIHTEQYTMSSEDAKKTGASLFVYGYAKEGKSSSSKYIAAAQEIETHCWEIEHAYNTSVPPDFLENRGKALTKYWETLYNKGKNAKKGTKPRTYYDNLKGRVEGAFQLLKKAGIDIEGKYFMYSSYGLKIK